VLLRVHYPNQLDQIVLRTEKDWERDIPPTRLDVDASVAEFELELNHPFIYLKPCMRLPSGVRWANGPNRLVVATGEVTRDIFPAFHSADEGRILDLITLDSKILNRQHSLRVYVPAGYEENICRSFPVMYMQDGCNLFFPQEAFMGQTGA
jgi:hypothetical protein